MPLRRWPKKDKFSAYCGLDFGTSGLKGVLINEAGKVLARGQASYPTLRPQPGSSEQNPADWLIAAKHVLDQLQAVVPAQNWGGLGLSAMIPTLVCLDEKNQPVGTAITWEDGRAESYGDKLRNTFGPTELYQKTGQWVDGRYLIPMWQRLVEVEPSRVSKTKSIAGAKDYLFCELTGQLLTDPSTATGFGCYDLRTGQWIDEVIQLSANNFELPKIEQSDYTLPLSQAASDLFDLPVDLPITLGAADSVLGALGMGVTAVGDIAYVAGTSTVILGISDHLPNDPQHRFLITPTAVANTWGIEMDLLATGSAIRWLSGLLGYENETAALQSAATISADEAPIFLPYVSPGEQGALWNPDLTGSVAGLTSTHSRAHLMRGLVNGILVESKRCIEVLRQFEIDQSQIQVAGGSALDPWFRQQLADVSTCQIIAPIDGDSDYSAMGAAMVSAGITEVTEGNKMVTNPTQSQHWSEIITEFDKTRLKLFN